MTFNYTIGDGVSPDTAAATATLVLSPLTPLTVADDVFACAAGAPCVVAAPGVLANDAGAHAWAPISVAVGATAPPAEGALALAADGSFTYTPPA